MTTDEVRESLLIGQALRRWQEDRIHAMKPVERAHLLEGMDAWIEGACAAATGDRECGEQTLEVTDWPSVTGEFSVHAESFSLHTNQYLLSMIPGWLALPAPSRISLYAIQAMLKLATKTYWRGVRRELWFADLCALQGLLAGAASALRADNSGPEGWDANPGWSTAGEEEQVPTPDPKLAAEEQEDLRRSVNRSLQARNVATNINELIRAAERAPSRTAQQLRSTARGQAQELRGLIRLAWRPRREWNVPREPRSALAVLVEDAARRLERRQAKVKLPELASRAEQGTDALLAVLQGLATAGEQQLADA